MNRRHQQRISEEQQSIRLLVGVEAVSDRNLEHMFEMLVLHESEEADGAIKRGADQSRVCDEHNVM